LLRLLGWAGGRRFRCCSLGHEGSLGQDGLDRCDLQL
jgi:hypothetical protein